MEILKYCRLPLHESPQTALLPGGTIPLTIITNKCKLHQEVDWSTPYLIKARKFCVEWMVGTQAWWICSTGWMHPVAVEWLCLQLAGHLYWHCYMKVTWLNEEPRQQFCLLATDRQGPWKCCEVMQWMPANLPWSIACSTTLLGMASHSLVTFR